MFSLSTFDIRMNKLVLLVANILAGVVFITLQNFGKLPIGFEHFIFFSFVTLLFALYRPAWAFLIFIGMIPYETIEWGAVGNITLRPYQWLTVIILLSVLLRLAAGKLPFKLFKPSYVDIFPTIILIGAFLSGMVHGFDPVSLKQGMVLGSFILVYLLGRIFLRTPIDVVQTLPFFISSSVVVFGYALWQNVRFLSGMNGFQVMEGRPNATFSEADWLGLFSLFVFILIYSLMVYLLERSSVGKTTVLERVRSLLKNSSLWFIFTYQTLAFVVILIAVSRSAWLGVLMAFIFLTGVITFSAHSFKEKFQSDTLFLGAMTLKSFLLAFVLIWLLHLTPFNLLDRAASTAHGLQKITIACKEDKPLPEKISVNDELMALGCRHINLEEKESVRENGEFIQEIYRDDPNVSIRKDTYGEVWKLITKEPILGIGWGAAAKYLGNDERGAGLNASNMFLEVWLGSGVFGFIAFVSWWAWIFYAAFRNFLSSALYGEKSFSIFILTGIVGISVFNFFNSGILLGFFFLFLSLGSLQIELSRESLKKNV